MDSVNYIGKTELYVDGVETDYLDRWIECTPS